MSIDENTVIEVRIHGRGGQGGVTAAQLCVDAFDGPGVCQPAFGAERMGSPTESYARMSKNPELVRTNEKVYASTICGCFGRFSLKCCRLHRRNAAWWMVNC